MTDDIDSPYYVEATGDECTAGCRRQLARVTAMKINRRRWLLLSLVLAAYAWRVTGLDRQSLWRDEVDAIYFAVRNLDETLSMFVQAAQNGPLYFLSLRAWFAVMGTTEFVLRYPSVVAGYPEHSALLAGSTAAAARATSEASSPSLLSARC